MVKKWNPLEAWDNAEKIKHFSPKSTRDDGKQTNL